MEPTCSIRMKVEWNSPYPNVNESIHVLAGLEDEDKVHAIPLDYFASVHHALSKSR